MKNFFKRNSEPKPDYRNSRNEPKSDYRNKQDDREMFTVTCADCGKSCQVPFKPNGGKPVFCRDCFSKDNRNPKSDRRGGTNYTMHKATCSNCGDNCEVPFKPSKDKQIYCSRCFSQGGSSAPIPRKVAQVDYSKQFDDLNRKLDKVLRMLAEKGLEGEKGGEKEV